MSPGAWIAIALVLGGAGCHQPRFHYAKYKAHSADPEAARVQVGQHYAALLEKSPLGPDENIRVTPLAGGAASSVSLVQVRDREQPHVHTRYDLTVYVVRGEGTLWLEGTPMPMQAGDAAYIEKGATHYFVNQGREPAASIVVFAPAFSGPDQQPAP
jgi:quercetin dioxygenase-like cupin family protein